MKRLIPLFLVFAFVAGACGGGKNKEHEYILSLLEQGEYDKAIQVIEILRDGEEGTKPQPVQTAATEAPATEPSVRFTVFSFVLPIPSLHHT